MIQVTSAQLKVIGNGNVGIQTGTNTPLSSLVVGNHAGNSGWKSYIYGNNTVNGLNVIRSNELSTWSQAIQGVASVTTGSKTIGVYGFSTIASPAETGRAFGVLGYASNATPGYNYAVMGILGGNVNGAAVVGTFGDDDVYVNGRYAGYFNGNVKVTGLINEVTIGDSDVRYKQNIVALGGNSTGKFSSGSILNTLLQMTPVQYNLKQVYFEPESDTATVKRGYFDEKSQLFQKKHYGLVAQDLQKLYPDLVYEDDNGYLSINYTGIVPLLIQSIKELKAEVDELKGSGSSMQKTAQSNTSLLPVETGTAALYQTLPTPLANPHRLNTIYLQRLQPLTCVFTTCKANN